jgi:hypothetical protein
MVLGLQSAVLVEVTQLAGDGVEDEDAAEPEVDGRAELDAEWKLGQAWVAGEQHKEEVLLAKGKDKQVFGY